MKRQRQRDTTCEIALRSELHRRGLRFRVDVPLEFNRRRRADVAFRKWRVMVFVDGCFWHACEEHSSWPRHNSEWWRSKLQRNRARDAETDRALRSSGWTVLRIWEHEDVLEAADRVEDALRRRCG
jgi:DNA mismatch endonuclease (patch repair protein)